MGEMYVRHVELLGFEKRFFPSQHYVYMLMVKWSDLSEKLIYRRYPEIHTFHKSLIEMFPIESGYIERKDRIIPSLPAPKWLDSQKSTETRQSTLAEYCQALISLPPRISHCKLLCDFFRVRPEDENPPAPHPVKRNETFVVSNDKSSNNVSEISGPIILESYRVIADYKKTTKHEIELQTGEYVEIVEKSPNGWWFCQCEFRRGWVPASYLEPLDGPEESEEAEPNYEGELNITIKDYKATQDDELSLEQGVTVEVIHKLLDGWWVVRSGEETGHFPSMFLLKTGAKRNVSESDLIHYQKMTPPPRRSTIRNAKSIHGRDPKKISQDTYRRNSKRFLQQKGGRTTQPRKTLEGQKEETNEEKPLEKETPAVLEASSELVTKQRKETSEVPVIPPRPSAELILERCTEGTLKRLSLHGSSSSSS